jgi:hypothetical protein
MYRCKDGRELKKQDFVTVETTIQDLIKDMTAGLPHFLEHHDLMKWQGKDLKLKRVSRRRTVSSTQDFSQSGNLQPKLTRARIPILF